MLPVPDGPIGGTEPCRHLIDDPRPPGRGLVPSRLAVLNHQLLACDPRPRRRHQTGQGGDQLLLHRCRGRLGLGRALRLALATQSSPQISQAAPPPGRRHQGADLHPRRLPPCHQTPWRLRPSDRADPAEQIPG